MTDHIKHSGTEIRDKAAAILVGAGAVTADKIDRAKALSLIEVDPADYDWDETVERQS
ncbi:MAG: hypothetical protein Q8R92_08715 [Deltaproteobacteria bacterium]|nr:hypothetical protein [Deltaproteobacteria bacterium]